MHYSNISNHTDFSFMRTLHRSENMKHFLQELLNYIFIYWNTWQQTFAWFNLTDFPHAKVTYLIFILFFLSIVSLLYVWKWWNWNQLISHKSIMWKKKRSEVFEGIAHFVKIYITIKANGFHKFLRLCCRFMTVMLRSLNLLSPVTFCQLANRAKMSSQQNHQRRRPLLTAGVLAPAPSPCHKARTTWDEQVLGLTESKHARWTNSKRTVAAN